LSFDPLLLAHLQYVTTSYKILIHSLIYIAENMDPVNILPPLFEVKLELNATELNYVPSFEPHVNGNFVSIFESIINDVMHMTTMIPRIFVENNQPHYLVSNLTHTAHLYTPTFRSLVHFDPYRIIDLLVNLFSRISKITLILFQPRMTSCIVLM